jgi:hypothetical protein
MHTFKRRFGSNGRAALLIGARGAELRIAETVGEHGEMRVVHG